MTLHVQLLLSVEIFIEVNEIKPARIGQVVCLVVNFACRVKLTGPFIDTLIANSINILN